MNFFHAFFMRLKNARLLDLNDVRLDPRLTHVTGVVLADSGSPFRQSVLLNVGARDGIRDGWATMDGIGLVGRISGVGQKTSRVILLTDSNSRVPVTVQPSGQKAILSGDNSPLPPLEFIEDTDEVRPGDRVVICGAGPVGLLAAHLFQLAAYRVTVVDPDPLRRRQVADSGLADVHAAMPLGDTAFQGQVALVVDCSATPSPDLLFRVTCWLISPLLRLQAPLGL